MHDFHDLSLDVIKLKCLTVRDVLTGTGTEYNMLKEIVHQRDADNMHTR